MAKLRPSGGYRDARSFQTATIIYDATYWFCERFLDPRSRTVDQMIQAARSGRQNIAEASRTRATSSQSELRLLNVARSSLEELLLDYEDFLRHRHLAQWSPDAPDALAVRRVAQSLRPDPPDRESSGDSLFNYRVRGRAAARRDSACRFARPTVRSSSSLREVGPVLPASRDSARFGAGPEAGRGKW
jgi:four helix bundle protein